MLAALLAAAVLAQSVPVQSAPAQSAPVQPTAPLSPEQVQALSKASAKAMTDRRGAVRGKALGRISTPLGEAEAFRTEFSQGAFIRRYVFLVRPNDAAQGPVTVMLTSNAMADQLAGMKGDPKPYFLDLYTCHRHVTLDILPKEPSFEELRDLVAARLQEKGGAVSSTEAQGGGPCPYAGYVFPGLPATGG